MVMVHSDIQSIQARLANGLHVQTEYFSKRHTTNNDVDIAVLGEVVDGTLAIGEATGGTGDADGSLGCAGRHDDGVCVCVGRR